MGMSSIPLPWGEESPEPLIHMCAKNLAENPDTFCDRYVDTGNWVLKPGHALPQEMCEKLVNVWQEIGAEKLNDEFIGIFEDISRTRLKRVMLRSSSVTNQGVNVILRHKLVELDLNNCKKLTEEIIPMLNSTSENLISLVLCKNIFVSIISFPDVGDEYSINKHLQYISKDLMIKSPNLRKFVLRDLEVPRQFLFFSSLLKSMDKLNHLDLSGCSYAHDLVELKNLHNISTLILHGVKKIQDIISYICGLHSLRFLDISQAHDINGSYDSPDEVLEKIVTNLPLLSGLDISGTNLSGDGVFPSSDMNFKCDIPGLQPRVDKPLNFLGLYNTPTDACKRYSIPALIIAGEGNEEQILAATEAYLDRPAMLVKALNELFHIFRYETCFNESRALKLILHAMMKHKMEKEIQISGSASLFYIAKNEAKQRLNYFATKKIITVLLDAMDKHTDDSNMMRNGCLTICQFRIPQDVGFGYRRLVELMLKLVSGQRNTTEFVRRIAMYLLNSLACQVDGPQKELVGDLGAIEIMLSLISERLSQHLPDDVLEIAWAAMWNITDETPQNCERFLTGEGIVYFQRCLREFPSREELLRNMMGLLGNVAEVEFLRPKLMENDLIATFTELLDSTSDGIEVSYNAAGVLSHIASDGAEAWTIQYPKRESVLARMKAAILRWDILSKRNINYRSFEPILRLLCVTHTPECQLWAVWALANLTKVSPEKYCTLIEEEGGLEIMENLQSTKSELGPRIIMLAECVTTNCEIYREQDIDPELEFN